MVAHQTKPESNLVTGVHGHPLDRNLPVDDQQLLLLLIDLLGQDPEVCESGVQLIQERLTSPLPQAKNERTVFLYGLACRLVDLASEAHNEEGVRKSLKLFETIEEDAPGLVSDAIYKYNRANALKSLSDFYLNPARKYNLRGVARLTQAKDMYWRAVRALDDAGHFWPDLWINLANSLDQSSRIAEAIYWYDAALSLDPTHPMAHGNRAQALGSLHWLTGQFSIVMLAQAARGFEKGLTLPDLQQSARAQWQQIFDHLAKFLRDLDQPSLDEIELEMQIEEQSAEHSDYRTFCIGNGLVLTEHGLYCHCVGARRDDLSIIKSSASIPGEFVPRMELLLNRLKAEYCWARVLYFQSTTTTEVAWDVSKYEGTFSELQEGEAIGLRPEMLRTSLRLCFGILDRIAFGICHVLDIETFNRPLNFTSFWNDRGLSKERREARWEKLNRLCTPSLVALYSQATDLNIKKGEWGHFKGWRNALEHRLLFLLLDEESETSALVGESRSFDDAIQVPISVFRAECLHLLRFTASAIFNFAFCVRQVALRIEEEGPSTTMTLDKKPIGPE